MRQLIGRLLLVGATCANLAQPLLARAAEASSSELARNSRTFEAGAEREVTTGNFCDAPKLNADGSADGNFHANFYILNGFEGEGYPIPKLKITVMKNDQEATVVFHATDASADIGTFTSAIGPFTHFVRPCDDIDPLWARKLVLREVTRMAFDGVDVVDGPDGPNFRMRKGDSR